MYSDDPATAEGLAAKAALEKARREWALARIALDAARAEPLEALEAARREWTAAKSAYDAAVAGPTAALIRARNAKSEAQARWLRSVETSLARQRNGSDPNPDEF